MRIPYRVTPKIFSVDGADGYGGHRSLWKIL
jgi:hypothetical protein